MVPRCPKPDALVLAGGGVKGVATLGAVHRLQHAGLLKNVRTVVGTSAGALIGALVATRRDLQHAFRVICDHGYTPDFDFDRFFKEFGLDSGKSISSLVDALLESHLTFEDVRRLYGMRFVVCVTNLSQRRAEYLGPDTHPDMPLALALRMSCSVPLYFSAVRHEGAWYADGSIVDNFPCAWALDNGAAKVLGISTKAAHTSIRTFEAFVGALMESAAGSQTCARADILDLELPGVSALNFGARQEEMAKLFAMGDQQASVFLKKAL